MPSPGFPLQTREVQPVTQANVHTETIKQNKSAGLTAQTLVPALRRQIAVSSRTAYSIQ